MTNSSPQFEIEADRIMWDMIAKESSLSATEQTQYQELLSKGGLLLIDPDHTGNYVFVSKKDLDEIIRRDKAKGSQSVWLHPSYGGDGREKSYGDLLKTFDDTLGDEGDILDFSAGTYLSARVFPRLKIESPAAPAQVHEEEESSSKKEEVEKSALVKQIESDYTLSEQDKADLIAMAEEGNLVYAEINGTGQYLSSEYVEYLIEQGNDPELEVEILMTQDGSNEGEKVTLEDLLDVLERSDAFETAAESKKDQPAAKPNEAPVAPDSAPVLSEEEHPEYTVLPPDFVAPARLQDLSASLPKVSGRLPGGLNISKIEHEVETTITGQDAVQLNQERPQQLIIEGEEEVSEDQTSDLPFDKMKPPKAPQQSAPGQQQPNQPDNNLPADQQALKEVAEQQQEDVDKQLEEGAEKEEEEKNKKRYQSRSPKKKKKFWTIGKFAVLGGAGALGMMGGTLFGGASL